MKSFEYSGMWWLPSHSEYKMSGKLTFVQNDRIDIALNSLLEPDRDVLRKQTLKRYPLILGVTDDGQAITLFDCRETNVEHITSDEDSYAKHECSAMGAYIGAHFTSPEPLFHKMDVHYSHLPEWAGIFPFQGYQNPFDEVKTSTTKGTIAILCSDRLGREWIGKADLPETVWMRIEVQEALSLGEWNTQFLIPLQYLLSLVTQRPNAILGIRAYTKQTMTDQSSGDNAEISVQAVTLPDFVPFAPTRTVFPETILFPLQKGANNFSQIMDSWLRTAEELNSVCSLFFGLQYARVGIEQRFLTLAQAAESYQDRRSDKSYLPEEEYQRLMAVLLDACPDDHKIWLKEKLQYANSTPFRKQLKKLVKNTSQILQPLIGKSSAARKRFAEKVYNTRNYLTHYTDELKSEAARGDDLFLTMQYLRLAVETCLLYELGFTPELCAEMFQRHEVYAYILGLMPYSS